VLEVRCQVGYFSSLKPVGYSSHCCRTESPLTFIPDAVRQFRSQSLNSCHPSLLCCLSFPPGGVPGWALHGSLRNLWAGE